MNGPLSGHPSKSSHDSRHINGKSRNSTISRSESVCTTIKAKPYATPKFQPTSTAFPCVYPSSSSIFSPSTISPPCYKRKPQACRPSKSKTSAGTGSYDNSTIQAIGREIGTQTPDERGENTHKDGSTSNDQSPRSSSTYELYSSTKDSSTQTYFNRFKDIQGREWDYLQDISVFNHWPNSSHSNASIGGVCPILDLCKECFNGDIMLCRCQCGCVLINFI